MAPASASPGPTGGVPAGGAPGGRPAPSSGGAGGGRRGAGPPPGPAPPPRAPPPPPREGGGGEPARIHAVPTDALGCLARPALGKTPVEGQLADLEGMLRQIGEPHPGLGLALRWLGGGVA